jgi:fibronectin-binding autotransporter adhesin
LRVAADTNLGALGIGVILNGGELETSADFTSARTVTLTPVMGAANTLSAAVSTTAIYTGLISGTGGLTVGDPANPGTVVLTGNNTYTGGTTVSGAALRVANNLNLGNINGGVILDGGELAATGSEFLTFRPILLTPNNGTLAAEVSGLADFQGNITGSGALTIGDAVNTGIVEFSGTNTYLGSTTIVSGTTLKALSTGALSPASAFIVTGTLDLNGFSDQVGSLTGTGAITNGGLAVATAGGDDTSTTLGAVLHDGTAALGLAKVGTGTLTLVTDSTYTGGTAISAGTLRIGNGGTSGSIVGNVTDNGNLAF